MKNPNLNILNYKNNMYFIYLEDKNLIIKFNNISNIIDKNVNNFSLDYYENKLYIVYINDSGILKFYKISLDKLVKLEHINLSSLFIEENYKIQLFTIIQIEQTTNIIFQSYTYNNNETAVYYICINENNIKIFKIDNVECPSYVTSFQVCKNSKEIYVLICNDYKRKKYILYKIKETQISQMENISLSNCTNVYDMVFCNKLMLYYGKIENKNLVIKCKSKDIEKHKDFFKDEKSLPYVNISKLCVSSYNKKVYICYKKNRQISLISSSDRTRWTKILETKYDENEEINKVSILQIGTNEKYELKVYSTNKILWQIESDKLLIKYKSPKQYRRKNEYEIKNKSNNNNINKYKFNEKYLIQDINREQVNYIKSIIHFYKIINYKELKYKEILNEQEEEIKNLRSKLMETLYENKKNKEIAILSNIRTLYYVNAFLKIIEEKNNAIELLLKDKDK